MIFTIPIYSVNKVILRQTLKSEIKNYPIFNSNLVPQYKVLVIVHQLLTYKNKVPMEMNSIMSSVSD